MFGSSAQRGPKAVSFDETNAVCRISLASPEQTLEVVDISIAEIRDVVANGVTQAELELAKEQARASLLMSLEDSASRAAALAQSEMLHGRQISLEESLKNTEAVTLDDIRKLARKFFRTDKIAFAALGNLKGLKINRKRLAV